MEVQCNGLMSALGRQRTCAAQQEASSPPRTTRRIVELRKPKPCAGLVNWLTRAALRASLSCFYRYVLLVGFSLCRYICRARRADEFVNELRKVVSQSRRSMCIRSSLPPPVTRGSLRHASRIAKCLILSSGHRLTPSNVLV